MKLLYKKKIDSHQSRKRLYSTLYIHLRSTFKSKALIHYLPRLMVAEYHRGDWRNFPWSKAVTSLQLQPLSGTAHFQILVHAEVQRPNFPASIWDISDVPSAKAFTAFALQFKFFLCLIQLSLIINGMDKWQNGNYESVHLITS